ncbi:MAG: TlpA disulfide reductase family protein [Tissierellia bacterium]|nr:TlpA disulfide reductase family protein [Tissierellia bacterium]
MKKILIIILSIALIAGCTNNPAEIPDNDVQEAIDEAQETNDETKNTKEPVIAPDFELTSMEGSVIKLSETRDKNVILNFWYTGCVFCVTEMPDLQKLQETYPDDLLLLAINVGESKEVIEDFMDENNLSFTVLQDEDMLVAYDYGIRSFPTTIAINKKGEVVSGYIGMLTYEQMEQLYGLFE